jgi:GNAT superfamily N-acetyltransferase
MSIIYVYMCIHKSQPDLFIVADTNCSELGNEVFLMTNIGIRNAVPPDFDKLPFVEVAAAQAFKAIGLQAVAHMPPTPPEDYHQLPASAFVLVAETDEQIIGFCVVTELCGEAHLKEISVAHDFAGKGVGKRLLLQALTQAQTRDYTAMTLTTFKDVPFNAPFYKNLGFAEFQPDNRWPQLQTILAQEAQSLLGQYERIAMMKPLNPQPDL